MGARDGACSDATGLACGSSKALMRLNKRLVMEKKKGVGRDPGDLCLAEVLSWY